MAGPLRVGDATFNSLATGAILVVAIAVLGSITVLPALLAKLGRWVDRPRVPLLWRLNRRIGRGGISRRILAPVLRRPVVALAAPASRSSALLAVPALGMKIHAANLETLPDVDPRGADTFTAIAPGVPVRGHDGDGRRAGGRRRPRRRCAPALRRPRAARRRDAATSSRSARRPSRSRRTAARRCSTPGHAVRRVRPRGRRRDRRRCATDLAPAALDGLGAEYAVGGDAAESLDFVEPPARPGCRW